jgi:hypothetical protein
MRRTTLINLPRHRINPDREYKYRDDMSKIEVVTTNGRTDD